MPAEYEAESDAGLASLPPEEKRRKPTMYDAGGADDGGVDVSDGRADADADADTDADADAASADDDVHITHTANASAAVDASTEKPTSMMPSDEEISAYATHLGMDPLLDAEFLYIAEWALTAPVPNGRGAVCRSVNTPPPQLHSVPVHKTPRAP